MADLIGKYIVRIYDCGSGFNDKDNSSRGNLIGRIIEESSTQLKVKAISATWGGPERKGLYRLSKKLSKSTTRIVPTKEEALDVMMAWMI